MEKAIDYKANINNPDSFIVYKLCIMPESVLSKEYHRCSYKYLIMNNELIKLLNSKLFSRRMCDNISLYMLIYIEKIVKESINFYYSFNKKSQNFSKMFKNKKMELGEIEFNNKKRPNDDLYLAKYICYKEIYDLELPINKIKNFDINSAEKVLNMIHSIIDPNFNPKHAISLRKEIIKCLEKDIKSDHVSTTLDEINVNQLANNKIYFKALICQQEILDCIKILFYENKITLDTIDIYITILNYSIDASNGIISLNLKYLIDKKDIESFNKEEAIKLRNAIICEKYKRTTKQKNKTNIRIIQKI